MSDPEQALMRIVKLKSGSENHDLSRLLTTVKSMNSHQQPLTPRPPKLNPKNPARRSLVSIVTPVLFFLFFFLLTA